MTAQDAGDVAWAITQIGDVKNMANWNESQLARLQAGIDYFDNTFGLENGPKVYQMAMQGAEATDKKDVLKYEQQLVKHVNSLAALAPTTPPEFEPDTGAAFNKGLQSALAGYFPDNEANKALVREAQARSEQNPIAAGAGKFIGGMLPAVGVEMALGKIPGVGKALNKVIPGKGFKALAAREMLMNQGPTARAIAAGGITGAINRDENALTNAAFGGIFAKGGEALLGRMATKPSNRSKADQTFIKKMEKKGYWASPGLESGRAQAMMLDQALEKSANTAHQVKARLDHNKQLLTESVAEQIGLPSGTKHLGLDVIDRQREVLNDKLDTFYAKVKPNFKPKDLSIIQQIKDDYIDVMGEDIPRDLEKRLKAYTNTVKRQTPSEGNENIRKLIKITSDRAHFHYTNQAGNPEAAKGFDTLHKYLTKRMGDFGTSKQEVKQWRIDSEQQGLLLDLVKTDKNMLTTGEADPAAIMKIFNESGTHKIAAIRRRQDMFDAAKFALMQSKSFISSQAMRSRLGQYFRPKQRTSNMGTLADLASSSQIPLISTIPTAWYLSRGAKGLLPSGAIPFGGNVGGAYGAAGMPSLEFLPGLLGGGVTEENL